MILDDASHLGTVSLRIGVTAPNSGRCADEKMTRVSHAREFDGQAPHSSFETSRRT